MPEEVKFTEDELKQVQDIQNSYTDITNNFGQISLTKIRLEQQMESLNTKYAELVKNLTDEQEKEQTFLDGITEKYGRGTLNPETGVFTPTENKS